MLKSRIPAPWALTLWGLVFFVLLAVLLPWQVGKMVERAMPAMLQDIGQALQGELQLKNLTRAWRRTDAQLEVSLPTLAETIPLALDIRHGPWLGLDGVGLLAARIPWPDQGGISPFPPDERLEVRVNVGLLGDAWLGVWRLTGGQAEKLGSFRLERGARTLIGETRLPGLLIKHARGDIRLAEMNVRARLAGESKSLQGVLGLDAIRAGLGQGADAWLIEQPRLDLNMADRRQMSVQWLAVRGGRDLGRLDMALRWHGVDWPALRASLDRRVLKLNDPQRIRRQLDRFGLALGSGEIVLDRFELIQPAGKVRLEGLLRGRDVPPSGDAMRPNTVPTGLRRLHVDLRVEMDRALALQVLRASRWVSDEAGAQHLLETLREQHILDGDTSLRGALSLWDGSLTLSGRPMALDDVLGVTPKLNSDGIN